VSESTGQATATESAKPRTFPAKSFAAHSAASPLVAHSILRREPLPSDVQIEILFCGVCHSDLHQARNEWKEMAPTVYPVVPGHEIVGRVVKVGSAVAKFKRGDIAAVGCMVDSDRTCPNCLAGDEQYCDSFPTLTYNGPDKHLGGVTYGGYSDSIVVDEAFVLRVSDKLNLAGAAPLLCAGITTYSPMRHWNVQKGQKVGVVGLGGLGHMGVKFANAFGANVVLFTTSAGKVADAKRVGAHEVIISRDAAESLHCDWRVALQAPAAGRLHYRRHSRDTGNARFLRREQRHRRRGSHCHSGNQQRLRPPPEERRQIPLHNRHVVAEARLIARKDPTLRLRRAMGHPRSAERPTLSKTKDKRVGAPENRLARRSVLHPP
jgi:D-arabinose 1-dehydrogenase-like Zn-dependent alcohol dehydrogenase